MHAIANGQLPTPFRDFANACLMASYTPTPGQTLDGIGVWALDKIMPTTIESVQSQLAAWRQELQNLFRLKLLRQLGEGDLAARELAFLAALLDGLVDLAPHRLLESRRLLVLPVALLGSLPIGLAHLLVDCSSLGHVVVHVLVADRRRTPELEHLGCGQIGAPQDSLYEANRIRDTSFLNLSGWGRRFLRPVRLLGVWISEGLT